MLKRTRSKIWRTSWGGTRSWASAQRLRCDIVLPWSSLPSSCCSSVLTSPALLGSFSKSDMCCSSSLASTCSTSTITHLFPNQIHTSASFAFGPMHFVSRLQKPKSPSMIPLLSTCAVVGPMILRKRHKKAVNSAVVMVRCTSSYASIPCIGHIFWSWSSCITNNPHTLHLPEIPKKQRAIGGDVLSTSFDWHAPSSVRFPLSDRQVAFPPLAFTQKVTKTPSCSTSRLRLFFQTVATIHRWDGHSQSCAFPRSWGYEAHVNDCGSCICACNVCCAPATLCLHLTRMDFSLLPNFGGWGFSPALSAASPSGWGVSTAPHPPSWSPRLVDEGGVLEVSRPLRFVSSRAASCPLPAWRFFAKIDHRTVRSGFRHCHHQKLFEVIRRRSNDPPGENNILEPLPLLQTIQPFHTLSTLGHLGSWYSSPVYRRLHETACIWYQTFPVVDEMKWFNKKLSIYKPHSHSQDHLHRVQSFFHCQQPLNKPTHHCQSSPPPSPSRAPPPTQPPPSFFFSFRFYGNDSQTLSSSVSPTITLPNIVKTASSRSQSCHPYRNSGHSWLRWKEKRRATRREEERTRRKFEERKRGNGRREKCRTWLLRGRIQTFEMWDTRFLGSWVCEQQTSFWSWSFEKRTTSEKLKSNSQRSWEVTMCVLNYCSCDPTFGCRNFGSLERVGAATSQLSLWWLLLTHPIAYSSNAFAVCVRVENVTFASQSLQSTWARSSGQFRFGPSSFSNFGLPLWPSKMSRWRKRKKIKKRKRKRNERAGQSI